MSAKELKATKPRGHLTDVKVGDLVQIINPFTGTRRVGIYLGEKTFDPDTANYTCSMVYFTKHEYDEGLPQPRPIQSDMVHPLGGEEGK